MTMDSQVSQIRKRFSAEEKFKIVKEHLTTKTSVSELSKKYGMTPTSFYEWQDLFFAGAMSGFDKKRGPQSSGMAEVRHIESLEADLGRMREVIAEITAENIAFKKKSFPYPR